MIPATPASPIARSARMAAARISEFGWPARSRSRVAALVARNRPSLVTAALRTLTSVAPSARSRGCAASAPRISPMRSMISAPSQWFRRLSPRTRPIASTAAGPPISARPVTAPRPMGSPVAGVGSDIRGSFLSSAVTSNGTSSGFLKVPSRAAAFPRAYSDGSPGSPATRARSRARISGQFTAVCSKAGRRLRNTSPREVSSSSVSNANAAQSLRLASNLEHSTDRMSCRRSAAGSVATTSRS